MQDTKKLINSFINDEVVGEIEELLRLNNDIANLLVRIKKDDVFHPTIEQDLISVQYKNELQIEKLSKLVEKVLVWKI